MNRDRLKIKLFTLSLEAVPRVLFSNNVQMNFKFCDVTKYHDSYSSVLVKASFLQFPIPLLPAQDKQMFRPSARKC